MVVDQTVPVAEIARPRASAPATEGAGQVTDLAIEGMTCASCVARVEKKLTRLPGVGRLPGAPSRGTPCPGRRGDARRGVARVGD